MTAPKWIKRKNGLEMSTFRIRVHVPREMVTFLQEHTSMSQSAAYAWIVAEEWRIRDEWRAIVIQDGQPEIWHTDETDQDDDDIIIYEGPGLQAGR